MIRKKMLALVLSASIIVANLSNTIVSAAEIERTTADTLNLEKIKSEAMEIYNNKEDNMVNDDSGLYDASSQKTYKASDSVRVIITLSQGNGVTRDIVSKENVKIQKLTLDNMEAADINFNMRYKFTNDTNTMTGDIKYGDIEKIKDIENVKSVRLAKEYQANLSSSNTMIQAENVWKEYGYKGEGMAVAVLDTGFQVDHPDFKLSEEGIKRAKLTEENLEDILESTGVDDIYYNEKIPTGYDWANKDNDISPFDPVSANHGMHVAGIIGANGDIDNGGVKGIAPEVQIIGEKVFADDGRGYEDDIIAGINHAVTVGADVINMSLGSDAGFVLEDSDLMQIAIENATKAGVLVVVSAGNAYYSTKDFYEFDSSPYSENFDIGTVGDPSVSSYALSVASVENNGLTANVGQLSSGEKFGYLNQMMYNPVITQILGDKEYEIVKIDEPSSKKLQEVECEGKVILVPVDNAYNINSSFQSAVERAGGVGVIAYGEYNYSYNVNSFYKVPIVATGKEEGENISKVLEKDKDTKVRFTDNTTLVAPVENSSVSDFSGWGTTPTLDFKPEISGVGGKIYSTTPDGEHTIMSGTSMSSPQIAGAAAILLQHMKKNGNNSGFETAMMAKNILMNNTKIVEDIEEGVPYSPRKQGSGLLQLNNALSSPIIVYNENTDIQKRGSIALKEIGDIAKFNVAIEPILDKKLDYSVYLDLYTDSSELKEIDINKDGIVDYEKNINTLNSKEIENAIVTINNDILSEKGMTIKALDEKKVLDVSIDLSNSNISKNSFVEGYMRIVPEDVAFGELNIPIMGFYGDWNDAKNIDEPMVGGQPYAEYTAMFAYDTDTPLGFDMMTNTINEDGIAFSPKGVENLVGPRFTALRNLEYVDIIVENEDGVKVKDIYNEYYLQKNTFYNKNFAYNIADREPWDGTDNDGNLVDDGTYTFVIKSKFPYEGAQEQETRLNIKVDATDPIVSNIRLTKVDEGYEINFETIDETSGYKGAVLYIDGEYTPLEFGEDSYIVSEMPKELVVIAFDNAGNAGLGVYGDIKEVDSETLLLYYNVSGTEVNYEKPCYMFGAAQKSMTWKLSIKGPTGDIVYELDEFDDVLFNINFKPEQGEPNGVYTVIGTLLDKPTGIHANLPEYEFDIAGNEIYDKSGLFKAIMDMKEFISNIIIGDEVGQYPQDAVNKFKEELEEIIDIYYDPSVTDTDILSSIDRLNEAKEILEESINLSYGKESAIKLLNYCNQLLSEAVVGDRPGNYSQESIDLLKDAMLELQMLVDSEEEISDETFNEAIEELNKEIKVFLDSAIKFGDISKISNLINQQRIFINQIKNSETKVKYTEEDVYNFEIMINEYEEAIKDPLTVEEVEEKYNSLNEAIKVFMAKEIDISGLIKAVEKGEKFLEKIKDDVELYDEKAIEKLNEAISDGLSIIDSPYTTKEEVAKTIANIKKSIKDVKDSKKKPEKPEKPDTSKPNNPSAPDNPSKPGSENKPEKPSKPVVKPSKPDLPQTGGFVGSYSMIVSGLLLLGSGSLVIRKRIK